MGWNQLNSVSKQKVHRWNVYQHNFIGGSSRRSLSKSSHRHTIFSSELKPSEIKRERVRWFSFEMNMWMMLVYNVHRTWPRQSSGIPDRVFNATTRLGKKTKCNNQLTFWIGFILWFYCLFWDDDDFRLPQMFYYSDVKKKTTTNYKL